MNTNFFNKECEYTETFLINSGDQSIMRDRTEKKTFTSLDRPVWCMLIL
jgi:hypothetical protein